MRKAVYGTIILNLLVAGNAHAWGDENWTPQIVQVEVRSDPDYLQQRIETRRARFEAQQSEQRRIQQVIRKNDQHVKEFKQN